MQLEVEGALAFDNYVQTNMLGTADAFTFPSP